MTRRLWWHPELLRRAVEYRRHGLSNQEIASKLGCSAGAVRRRLLRELGAVNKWKNRPDLSAIIALKEKGLSSKEVARALNLTPGQVKGVYQRHVPKEIRLVHEQTRLVRHVAPIIALKERGLTHAEVADQLGLGECNVKEIYTQHVPKQTRLLHEQARRARRVSLAAKV